MSFKPSNRKKSLRIFWAITLSLMFILTGSLILQTGALARQFGELSSAQQKIVVLSNSQEQGSEETNSLTKDSANLEELAQNLNFEKIDQVHYIRATENTALAK